MDKTITVTDAQYERQYKEEECYRKAKELLRDQINLIFGPLVAAVNQARAEEEIKKREEK